MGDARHNPKSRQFRLDANAPTDPICMAQLGCVIEPSKAWQEANPAVDGEQNVALVPPEEVEVVFLIAGRYTERSALVPRERWADGAAPVAEIHRMPFVQFRSLIQRANPDQPWRSEKSPTEGLES